MPVVTTKSPRPVVESGFYDRGQLRESFLPGISVDNLADRRCSFFFLTHPHLDHLGLPSDEQFQRNAAEKRRESGSGGTETSTYGDEQSKAENIGVATKKPGAGETEQSKARNIGGATDEDADDADRSATERDWDAEAISLMTSFVAFLTENEKFRVGCSEEMEIYLKKRFKKIQLGDKLAAWRETGQLVVWKTGEKQSITVEQSVDCSFEAYQVDVTFLDAEHCLGSSMILFDRGDGQTTLHCGDARIEDAARFVKDNKRILGGAGPLHSIYLDTTFCHPGTFWFPLRKKSAQIVVMQINNFEGAIFLQLGAALGLGIDVFETIHKKTGKKIHVNKWVYDLYTAVRADLEKVLTKDKGGANVVHACEGKEKKECMEKLGIGADSGPPQMNIKATAAWYLFKTFGGVVQTRERKQGYVDVNVCYASHSPVIELKRLVRQLKPAVVHVSRPYEEKEVLFERNGDGEEEVKDESKLSEGEEVEAKNKFQEVEGDENGSGDRKGKGTNDNGLEKEKESGGEGSDDMETGKSHEDALERDECKEKENDVSGVAWLLGLAGHPGMGRSGGAGEGGADKIICAWPGCGAENTGRNHYCSQHWRQAYKFRCHNRRHHIKVFYYRCSHGCEKEQPVAAKQERK